MSRSSAKVKVTGAKTGYTTATKYAHSPVVGLQLTLSPPIPLILYTLPYWSNPPFLIFDIRALWRSVLSARAPECEKLKGGLDQYGKA